MRKVIHLLTAALCVSSYTMAATPSIGTVTAHGELTIDSYSVKGSGTIFDGSVVETGQSAQSMADVRLGNDSVITLYVDSRGTVYRDHFVLQQGKIELGSSSTFRVEANGLEVTSSAHASGFVSIESGNTVEVIAQNGDLEVRGASGTLVAQVHPGEPLAFSPVAGKPSSAFSATGLVSADKGHYYLKASGIDVTYELRGDNVQNHVGQQVSTSGEVDSSTEKADGAAATMVANSIVNLALVPRQSPEIKAFISGLSVSAAADAATSTTTVCYSAAFGGICCPRTTSAAVPLRCCPGVTNSPWCCPGVTYPSSECHHSW